MKNKTPPEGEVSRVSLEGRTRDFSTLSDLRSQYLVAVHSIRPSLAGVIASMAYGERCPAVRIIPLSNRYKMFS